MMTQRNHFLACLVMLACVIPVRSQQYLIRPLGIFNTEHTDPSGYATSQLREINSSWVVGDAFRFSAGGASLGNSLWAHHIPSNTTFNVTVTSGAHTAGDGTRQSTISFLDAQNNAFIQAFLFNGVGEATAWNLHLPTMTYTQLGLTGAGYSSTSGQVFSVAESLTPQGELVGWTNRYVGDDNGGRDVWIFNRQALTHTQYGLIDAAHTANTGYRYSTISGKSASGTVYGHSDRYDGQSSQRGTTAWINVAGTYTTLGLTNAEHTHADGYSANTIQNVDVNNVVLGSANRYNGTSNDLGATPWLYFSGTGTYRQIGLTSADYVRNADGYRFNSASPMDTDLVFGYVQRFAGPNEDQTDAFWVHRISTNTTTRIGLFDAAHTGQAGLQFSGVTKVIPTHVIGVSGRWTGITEKGLSAWVYRASTNTTTRIGLTDAQHTSSSGYQVNVPEFVNQNGIVAGYAQRFAVGTENELGQSAWLYRTSTNTTANISLTGTDFTQDTGYRYSAVQFLSESGFVAGFAERYVGGPDFLGIGSFLYDTSTDSTYVLQFSVRPSDQFSETTITGLNEDGSLFGYYQLFDASSNDLGRHAFTWSIANGFLQLGDAVVGGLAAYNWSNLEVIDGSYDDMLYGRGGYDPDIPGTPYLLTAVPEAKDYMLAAIVLAVPAGWYLRRRWVRQALEREVEEPDLSLAN
jgi:hypothetical protein